MVTLDAPVVVGAAAAAADAAALYLAAFLHVLSTGNTRRKEFAWVEDHCTSASTVASAAAAADAAGAAASANTYYGSTLPF